MPRGGAFTVLCIAALCCSSVLTSQADWMGETPAVYYPAHENAYPQEQSAVLQQNFDENWQSLRTFPLIYTLQAPIKVYVAQGPLYRPQFKQFVDNSMQSWSNALEGRLKYVFVNNPNSANIKIDWVNGYAEHDQAGETNAVIGSANITIKVPGLPENLIEADIMHELGHALGIMSHSKDNADIMKSGHDWSSYQEYKTYKAHLSPNDIRAIRYLYSTAWHPGEDVYIAVASTHQPGPRVALAQKIQHTGNPQ